jgi:hypothetical protein
MSTQSFCDDRDHSTSVLSKEVAVVKGMYGATTGRVLSPRQCITQADQRIVDSHHEDDRNINPI